MNPIESEGESVAQAVESALRQHGLRREQVEVTVLDEGHPGFLGIGNKTAKVRLQEKRWGDKAAPDAPPTPPQAAPARPPRRAQSRPTTRQARPAETPQERVQSPPPPETLKPRAAIPLDPTAACAKAQTLVVDLLRQMKIAAPTVSATWDVSLERVKLIVESQDAPAIVGRDGRVLESLQFLTTLILSRGAESPIAVQVDALSYWEKKEQALIEGARRGIDYVLAEGKPFRLEPMNASMRRLIHRTFANHPTVTTASEGEGPWRKIVLRLRKD